MVSSIGATPFFSYANQLSGVTSTPAPAATTDTSSGTDSSQTGAAASTAATAASSDASSLASSLLGGAAGGFTPEVLSLLQQNSSGSFDPVTSLLGGTSTNNGLTSLLSNLYTSASAATQQQAQTDGTTQKQISTPQASPVQALIDAQTQASSAYSQTQLTNAQSVVDANSYGANGVSPLVT
jgi:hypothetical protein